MKIAYVTNQYPLTTHTFIRREIRAHPDDWSKIHVVRCRVDKPYTDSRVKPPPVAPRLAFVGRIGRSKGHAVLVEAAARLADDLCHCEVVLIGDGPYRPNHRTEGL